VVCLRLKELLFSAVPQPYSIPVVIPQPYSIPVVIPQPQPKPVDIPLPVPVRVVPQPEVVIPEPVPQPIAISPWASHLAVFHDMGYFNDELISSLLEKYQGDVRRTVMALLESSTIL